MIKVHLNVVFVVVVVRKSLGRVLLLYLDSKVKFERY